MLALVITPLLLFDKGLLASQTCLGELAREDMHGSAIDKDTHELFEDIHAGCQSKESQSVCTNACLVMLTECKL